MSLEQILTTKAYGPRAKALHAYGAAHGASPAEVVALRGSSSFGALAAVTVAKGAGEDAAWAVEHPASVVRRTAIRERVLPPETAERLLLSPDTSRESRELLIAQGLVPANEATLAAAITLDKETGGSVSAAWRLLTRGPVTSAHFFRDNVGAVASASSRSSAQLRVTPKTASRHAREILAVLVKAKEVGERPPFEWDATWLTLVAVEDPRTLLKLLLVVDEAPAQSGGAQQHKPQRTTESLASLGWPTGRGATKHRELLRQLVRWAARTAFAILLELLTSRAVLVVSRSEVLSEVVRSPKATWREKRAAVVGTYLAFDRRDVRTRTLQPSAHPTNDHPPMLTQRPPNAHPAPTPRTCSRADATRLLAVACRRRMRTSCSSLCGCCRSATTRSAPPTTTACSPDSGRWSLRRARANHGRFAAARCPCMRAAANDPRERVDAPRWPSHVL
jgi:hypothetical protein